MKYLFAVGIACFTFLFQTNAQFTKQVVQFKNKAFTTSSLSNPTAYLSAKAILRRTRFGIAIDSTDLPITPRYLDSIRSVANVQILSVSRWLNRVLIKTSDAAAITKINSFTFVQATLPVGLRQDALQTTTQNKFTETTSTTDPTPNRAQQATGTNADSLNYGNSYAQIHIHEGEFLHNKNFMGQNITIAVLDAGFQNYKTITAFDSVRLQGRILGERDFVAFDNSVNEDDSHGMQCLSTIVANWPGRMVGTAPKAAFWLLRTEDAPSEYPVEEFNWVVGAEFADSVGADMISSSLGYNTFDNPQFDHTYAQLNGNILAITIGADLAAKKGMIITNSAGNEGGNSWQYIVAPADGDSVVTVGAVSVTGQIAGFSSRGIPADPRIKPNVVSVGQGTVIAGSTGPTFGNGTSFSCPNLNGLIACLWQAFPEYNNKKIMDVVYQSSDRFTTPDKSYGYGIPNFKKAYRALKKERNLLLFGSSYYLKATPNPFTDTIRVDFAGQADGSTTLQLISPTGAVVAQKTIAIEEQELYTTTFTNLGNFIPGTYTVKYADASNTKTVQLQKLSNGFDFSKDWMLVFPVPYQSNFTVAIKAPATALATIRLMDNNGKIISSYTRQTVASGVFSYQFTEGRLQANGVYYVEYNDGVNKKTKRVIKQ